MDKTAEPKFKMPQRCKSCIHMRMPKLDLLNVCTLCLYNTATKMTNNYSPTKPRTLTKIRA